MITIATLVAGGSVYHAFSRFKQIEQPVVETPAQIPRITALGRLEPASEIIRIAAPLNLNNDRIAQLLIQRGDSVQANQVIAVLDSRDRLETGLREAQEQVKVAQAKLAQVEAGARSGEVVAQQAQIARLESELQGEIATQQATIAQRQAEVTNARSEYDRFQQLRQQGAVSASQFDQRRLALQTAQAQLNAAQADRNRTADSLQAQIREAKANLARIVEIRPTDVQAAQAEVDQATASVRQAEVDLSRALIRAPIAGQVLEIYSKPGEAISTERGVADLAQTNSMQAIAEVDQSDIRRIQIGQTAVITGDSFVGEVRGNVILIGKQVLQQRATNNQPGENLDRRIVEVRIRLNPEDSRRVANLTNSQIQVSIQPNL